MSLNPLRLVKSLWSRHHPTSIPVDSSRADVNEDATHHMAQRDNPSGTQPQVEVAEPTPSSTTSTNGIKTASSFNISEHRLEDPFLENNSAATHLDRRERGNNSGNGQNHARCPSIASSVTLDHADVANECEGQAKADNISQNAHHGEKEIPEVSSVADDQSNDGASQSQHHTVSGERRKLNPKHQEKRHIKSAFVHPKHDYVSEITIENFTDTDPLPEGYLYTFHGIRCVKPSMKLTGLCGAEEGLHKLTCGHWISTPALQPCGVNCHTPSFLHEAFRCSECCNTVKTILVNTITAAEKEKLAHARHGYHVIYIALAVEYVTKHLTIEAGVTEAVVQFLDGGGRPCKPSDGPNDYEISIEQTVRDLKQRHKRKDFATENLLTRHGKREYSNDESHDAMPPAHTHKKHKTRAPEHPSSARQTAQSEKRKANDSDSDNFAPDDDNDRKRHKKLATPLKVLHNGATRSPHFTTNMQRMVHKRSHTADTEEEQSNKAVLKRRRVLKGPVWTEDP